MNAAPFAVAVDTREQLPFHFRDMRIDRRRAFVLTQKTTLSTGDYSIIGFENKICVERKSLEDLYNTLGNGRERFIRELERMQSFEAAMVVIEASWDEIMKPTSTRPLWHSQMYPSSVIGSMVAFAERYSVHWKPAGNRKKAEQETFNFLMKFWQNTITPENNNVKDENNTVNGTGNPANEQRKQAKSA